jgi:hypothetical protein
MALLKQEIAYLVHVHLLSAVVFVATVFCVVVHVDKQSTQFI